MRWLGVVGSLRKDSWNRHLLVALAERMPDGSSLDVRGIEGIPVYDGDLEAAAFPEVVVALQEAIAQADGVVLASPEYNFGVPGPLKNAVDWTSRGPRGRVWKGKRVAVIGGSPGPSGTRSAQFAWWPILRVLGARIHPDVLSVHGVASGFVDGRPTEELARRLTDFAVTLSTAP